MTINIKFPLTPGQRFHIAYRSSSTNKKPERSLLFHKQRSQGRNCYGRITSRRRGGGHKRLIRKIDFHRNKLDITATVSSIDYDPNRNANLALLNYSDGEKRYIIAPNDIAMGDKIFSTNSAIEEYKPGISLPVRLIPSSTLVHSVELKPGEGAKIARGAGSSIQIISLDIKNKLVSVRMPSGEVRYIHSNCRATIGSVGNSDYKSSNIGKAGRSRWMNKRPRVRGVAMNPIDHPHGGGEGKTSGGGHPVTPWGKFTKGYVTRKKSKTSNKLIITRRNGRKMKI